MAQQALPVLNLTQQQAIDAVDRIKCNDFQINGEEVDAWDAVELEEAGPNNYNLQPRGANNLHAISDAERANFDPQQRHRVKGRQSKLSNPYSQVWSALRVMNWDRRRPNPDILQWMDDFRDNVAQNNLLASNAARAQADQRLRQNLGLTIGQRFQAFTDILLQDDPNAPLRRPSWVDANHRFASHLCAFAQLVRVTKILYTQYLAIAGKLLSIQALDACQPQPEDAQAKRLRSVNDAWGIFNKVFLPAHIYVMAWCSFFGEILLGVPYGPFLFTNVWAYYLDAALARIRFIRANRRDKRKDIQDNPWVDEVETLLEPVRLRNAIANVTGIDPGGLPVAHHPVFPGPPPYMLRKHLIPNWQAYIAFTNQNQNPHTTALFQRIGGAAPHMKQYIYNQEGMLLRTEVGANPQLAVMFPGCLENDPRPTQNQITQMYANSPYANIDFAPVILAWPANVLPRQVPDVPQPAPPAPEPQPPPPPDRDLNEEEAVENLVVQDVILGPPGPPVPPDDDDDNGGIDLDDDADPEVQVVMNIVAPPQPAPPPPNQPTADRWIRIGGRLIRASILRAQGIRFVRGDDGRLERL